MIDGRGIDATDLAGSAGRGGDQRDDGADVLAEGIGRRPHRSRPSTRTRSRTYRIVGVVRDHKRHGVLERPSPFVYFADGAAPEPATTSCSRAPPAMPRTLLNGMRRELLAMEPSLVFMVSSTMEQNLANDA